MRGSIPASAAARLARGLIRMRAPVSTGARAAAVAGDIAAVTGAVAGGAVPPTAPPTASTAGAAASTGTAGSGVSGIASPGWPTQAQTWFTGTVSPSWATIRSRTPSSKASTSIADLSVSISNSTSPLATWSPSRLCQAMTVHSSVICPGFGIRIACGMAGASLCVGRCLGRG